MTERPKRISASVTEELKRSIRISAAEQGETMSSYVSDVLEMHEHGDEKDGKVAD